MRTKFKKIIFVFLIFCIAALAANSSAAIITIGIEATVTSVTDADNLLEGKVTVGGTITGTYTYDTSTPDTNPSSEVGDYSYYSPPCGITLIIGGLNIMSDPNNTMFTIGMTNATPGQMFNDSYGIRSFNNLPIFETIQVNELSWALVDTSNTAISSTALPTIAPILSNWSNNNTLSIGGGIGGIPPCWEKMFGIGAEVTSAFLIPEPVSLLLFGFGLLALRKQKK